MKNQALCGNFIITMVFVIIALALGGLWLSVYIYRTKLAEKPLVCPLDGSCDFVVHSGYSIILGIPVEILGIFYYSSIAFLHVAVLFAPADFYQFIVLVEVALSALGFLLSLYFTWLQLGVIKRWCTLCIGSALICIMIFILSLYVFWPVVSQFMNL